MGDYPKVMFLEKLLSAIKNYRVVYLMMEHEY